MLFSGTGSLDRVLLTNTYRLLAAIYYKKIYLLSYPHVKLPYRLEYAQYYIFQFVYLQDGLPEIHISCLIITGQYDQWVKWLVY